MSDGRGTPRLGTACRAPTDRCPVVPSRCFRLPTFDSLDTPQADPLHERALEEEEEGDYRQDDESRGRHEETVLQLALRLEEGQTKRKGVFAVVQEKDQRTD